MYLRSQPIAVMEGLSTIRNVTRLKYGWLLDLYVLTMDYEYAPEYFRRYLHVAISPTGNSARPMFPATFA